jgi:hypothetical protein
MKDVYHTAIEKSVSWDTTNIYMAAFMSKRLDIIVINIIIIAYFRLR